MKPWILGELAGSAGYSGGERYIDLLWNGLDHREFTVHVIFAEDGPFLKDLQNRRVQTYLIPLSPIINPFAIVKLARLLSRTNVNILQTHGFRQNVYGVLAGRLAGVKTIIWTIHNALQDYPILLAKRWLYRVILRLTVRWASRIICVSESIKKSTIQELKVTSDQAVTIYNGVDFSLFSPGDNGSGFREEVGLTTSPILVVIGRLTEQKGHRYLFEAIVPLTSRWPGLRCIIVGEGELEAELKILATRLGIAPHCLFTGARTDIPDVLAAADLVIVPSLSEGFPFVVLEAMAVGKPVVASAVNGIPEIIQDGVTGRLVQSRNSQDLTRVIQELLIDPSQAQEVAMHGSESVRAKFSAQRMIAETTNVLKSAHHE